VVDIEGERRINPACTYPARDGLIVRTHTEKLEKYRRQILELIFTEHNHFCFFCEASGDCELQALAYEYQLDHMRYPYSFPSLPTDTLNEFLVIDHNRCILCGRCIRVCKEIVANKTLDFGKRGWRTMVVADLNQPLGESSCTSCGACTQACPTGAIFSKVSAYRGRPSEGQIIPSLCSLCGAGCDIAVLVKDNNIVRIDGANLTGPKGQLCVKGRFRQLYKEAPRITTPLVVDTGGTIHSSSWEEALDLAATAIDAYMGRYGASSIAGLVSSLCPNETVEAFANLMHHTVGTSSVDTLDGSAYRTVTQGIRTFSKNGRGLEIEIPLESILEADCVLVVGANPLVSHPVVGSYILRAINQNGARLIIIDSQQNELGSRADLWLHPAKDGEEDLISAVVSHLVSKKTKRTGKTRKGPSHIDESPLEKAAGMIGGAHSTVVIYGEGIFNRENPALVAKILELANSANPDGPKVISLKPRGNSRGVWDLGVAKNTGIAEASTKLMYVMLADDEYGADNWLVHAKQAEFLIVQASYESPLTKAADVILPSPIWAERNGEYISLDGKAGRSRKVLEPLPGIRDDSEIFHQLARILKKRRPTQ
jgi:formate dehydrogenase major subunit